MLDWTDWTEEQKAAWRTGNWTHEKLNDLHDAWDEHVDICPMCQLALDTPPDETEDDEDYFCPLGEKLLEAYVQAITEYSWQPDFKPGYK